MYVFIRFKKKKVWKKYVHVFTVNLDMKYMYTGTNQFKNKKCPCNLLLLGWKILCHHDDR